MPTPSPGGDSPVGYAFGAFIFVVVVIAIIVCCIRTAPDATPRRASPCLPVATYACACARFL